MWSVWRWRSQRSLRPGWGVAWVLLGLLLGCRSTTLTERAPVGGEHEVFISPERLDVLRQQGVTLLDARGGWSYRMGHLEGAVHAPWTDFTEGGFQSGLLAPDATVVARLERLGVRRDTPVVVYGDWHHGWGEEGRVHWMLAYLGHPHVRILYGGMPLWEQLERETVWTVSKAAPGDFKASPQASLRATMDDVAAVHAQEGVVLLDVRTPAEFQGRTPYGSSRGGHIPGAVSLHWSEVFTEQGDLRPAAHVEAMLAKRGVGRGTAVVTYCTGGVRSGFMTAVLLWLGRTPTRNFDGSWWQWSQARDMPVERSR
ncbi:MAG: rhodanese-like domain-containing protein [Myxococcota bacterium]